MAKRVRKKNLKVDTLVHHYDIIEKSIIALFHGIRQVFR